MLEIRKASIDDSDVISQLGIRTFTEAFGHLFRDINDLHEYLERTFSKSKIDSSLNKEKNVFWLAFWNDLPVGYAKLKLSSLSEFVETQNICQLQKIYVIRDFLSKKIGLELQSTLLKEARSQGFEMIWLSVWKGNNRAIRFYEKNEFHKVGEHDYRIGKENFRFQVMTLNLRNEF